MDRLQGSMVQAAIKRLVKEFKSQVCFLLVDILGVSLPLVPSRAPCRLRLYGHEAKEEVNRQKYASVV